MQAQDSLTNLAGKGIGSGMRRLLIAAMLAWTAVAAIDVRAQALPAQTIQLGIALESFAAEADKQCPKMRAAIEAEKGKVDANNYWFLKEYQDSLCQCQPARVKALIAQRPAAELGAAVTQQQAMEYLMNHATAPCLGKVFREMLGGSQCKKLIDPGACACMAPEVAKMADRDLLQSGIAYKEYRDALAKSGTAESARPAVPAAAAPLVKLTERCSTSRR